MPAPSCKVLARLDSVLVSWEPLLLEVDLQLAWGRIKFIAVSRNEDRLFFRCSLTDPLLLQHPAEWFQERERPNAANSCSGHCRCHTNTAHGKALKKRERSCNNPTHSSLPGRSDPTRNWTRCSKAQRSKRRRNGGNCETSASSASSGYGILDTARRDSLIVISHARARHHQEHKDEPPHDSLQ